MAYESRPDNTPESTDLADDLKEVEAALAGFAPRPAKLNVAQLMYLAGQESAACGRTRATAWAWPALATVSTLAASVLAVMLATQSGPRVVERIVYVDRPATAPAPDAVADNETPVGGMRDNGPSDPAVQIPTPSYLQARKLVISQGIDSLPALASGSGSVEVRPATYRSLQYRALDGEPGARRKLPDAGFYSWPNLLLSGDHR